MEVDNTTRFLLAIQRKEKLQYYVPVNVWVETNEDDYTQFRFCARGEDSFRFPQQDVQIVSFFLSAVRNEHFI